jgi:TetR/AcrR family transcriptional regulator
MGIAERKEREKQQRREEIILAAERVFYSMGPENATMDDVAAEAELSKGTLYLYFKNKEMLHVEVARRAIILLNSFTSKAAEQADHAIEKLGQMGLATIQFSRTHPDQMRAIQSLMAREPGSVELSTGEVQNIVYGDSSVGMLLQIVEEGIRNKELRSDIPAPLIAHTLWMQMLSVIQFVSTEKILIEILELSPEKVFEIHFELVLNGIKS